VYGFHLRLLKVERPTTKSSVVARSAELKSEKVVPSWREPGTCTPQQPVALTLELRVTLAHPFL
jgi:hypothetical protein